MCVHYTHVHAVSLTLISLWCKVSCKQIHASYLKNTTDCLVMHGPPLVHLALMWPPLKRQDLTLGAR